MAKRLVRAKDFESAARYPAGTALELGDFETVGLRTILQDRQGSFPLRRFPLLYRIVEEEYGPEGSFCILPTQSLALQEEIEEMLRQLGKHDPGIVLYSFGPLKLTASDAAQILGGIAHMVDAAIRENASIYGFAD